MVAISMLDLEGVLVRARAEVVVVPEGVAEARLRERRQVDARRGQSGRTAVDVGVAVDVVGEVAEPGPVRVRRGVAPVASADRRAPLPGAVAHRAGDGPARVGLERVSEERAERDARRGKNIARRIVWKRDDGPRLRGRSEEELNGLVAGDQRKVTGKDGTRRGKANLGERAGPVEPVEKRDAARRDLFEVEFFD